MKCAPQVMYVSTFPPRRCGLATYTANLFENVDGTGLCDSSAVVAMSETPGEYAYGPEVVLEVLQDHRADYRLAADFINGSGAHVVCLQHEFGIFGGCDGEFILDLVADLRKPLVTTLHTVLSHPERRKQAIIKFLTDRSHMVVVMARRASDILTSVYGAPREKIALIAHGAPVGSCLAVKRTAVKARLGLARRTVICTLGLLNPGKGIEYVLEALPEVVERHPEVIYLVLGQTHPGVLRKMGEAYRDRLLSRVTELSLEKNVKFVDAYLTNQELIDYLIATDVYVTPYVGPEQTASGTLAYAVGMGKAIISTSYVYARELLEDGAGILVEFRDARSIAFALKRLIDSPEERLRLEARAQMRGVEMAWPRIGQDYARILLDSRKPLRSDRGAVALAARAARGGV